MTSFKIVRATIIKSSKSEEIMGKKSEYRRRVTVDVKKRWGEKKAAAIDGKETEERAEREEEKFKRITEW